MLSVTVPGVAKQKHFFERTTYLMSDIGGGKAFPMVVIGEKVIIGYNPERIALILDLKKEKE